MNGATATVGGKEFGEGGVKVIGDESGDNVFFTIWNDKEMASSHSVEVVLPSGTWVDAWLRTIGTWSLSFGVSIHDFC